MVVRRVGGRLRWVGLIATWVVLLHATPLSADSLEAPAETLDAVEAPSDVADGEDVVYEAGDSLATGEVELGLGLEGTASKKPQHRRRVRFDEPDFAGALREGSGDPLAGGEVEGRSRRDGFVAGKLSPRWSRGLLLGSSGDPWQRASLTGGARRGRAGEGVLIRRGERERVEALVGHFGRRDLAGLRGEHGPLGVGVLAGRGRDLQSSIGWRRGAGELETALDRGGSWRGEGLLARSLGAWSVAGSVRAGSAAFRSLAEPTRRGPSRALTAVIAGPAPAADLRLLASAWRFHAGQGGARLAVELRRTLSERSRLVGGFEEQHGARKEGDSGAAPPRQGGWLEWSGGVDPLRLGVRHESWGDQPWLRDVVRSVTSMRVDARAPLGVRITLAHSIYRTRRSESLYLAESESDRLVLRALSGEGQRSKLELQVPAGRRGRVRATVLVAAVSGRPRPPQWTLEWIRRSREDRAAPATPGVP